MKTLRHKNTKIQKYKNRKCLNVCMFVCLNDNRGYSAIVSVFLVTTIGIIVAISTSSVLIKREKIIRNIVDATQSYYTAEASIEDTLLRVIDPSLTYQTTENLALAGSTASTTVNISGSTLTIVSDGNKNDRFRSLSVELEADTSGASFNYGIQVGEGGIEMKNSATIQGNIYSDGDIVGSNSPVITGDAWASGNHTISGFTIGGDAHANTLDDNDIGGDAYYQNISGGSVSGTSYPGSPNPPTTTLPITQVQIDAWKQQAMEGGQLVGDQLFDDGNTYLGPKKIVGDLIIGGDGDDVVTLGGTTWVTGSITLENSGVLQLDSGYGSNSGVVVADGGITIKNNFIVCGSEGYNLSTNLCNSAEDSYVMLLSTVSGEDAISLKNNAIINGIVYTQNGEIQIDNNATVKAVVGYEIEVENNVIINYESGLINSNFSSGPGGGWSIGDWKEVE